MKKIIITVVIVVGTLTILFNLQTNIHVQRSAIINASTEEIKQEVTDFRKFSTWSPWVDIDPEATTEFSKNQGEVGATFSWSGNENVGTGKQEITSISNNRVEIKLTFTEPWQSESNVYYQIEPVERGTSITWGYDGELPLMVSLIQDMDAILGDQYEKGLKSLKLKYQK